MPVTEKNKKSKAVKRTVIDPKVGNYEKHPFFVKKANDAKELLQLVGLPKKNSR